jgi:hypothetical protein
MKKRWILLWVALTAQAQTPHPVVSYPLPLSAYAVSSGKPPASEQNSRIKHKQWRYIPATVPISTQMQKAEKMLKDPAFTQAFYDRMHQAGLTLVRYGLITVGDRVVLEVGASETITPELQHKFDTIVIGAGRGLPMMLVNQSPIEMLPKFEKGAAKED